jgi:hypothetical protein
MLKRMLELSYFGRAEAQFHRAQNVQKKRSRGGKFEKNYIENTVQNILTRLEHILRRYSKSQQRQKL